MTPLRLPIRLTLAAALLAGTSTLLVSPQAAAPAPAVPEAEPAPAAPPVPSQAAAPEQQQPEGTVDAVQARVPNALAIPTSVRLRYKVFAEYKRLPLTGSAALTWRQNGEQYDARLEIAMLNQQRQQASTGKQIDAAYIWEPTLAELHTEGAHVLTDSARVGEQGSPTYDLSGARADFVAQNPRFFAVWVTIPALSCSRRSLSDLTRLAMGSRIVTAV